MCTWAWELYKVQFKERPYGWGLNTCFKGTGKWGLKTILEGQEMISWAGGKLKEWTDAWDKPSLEFRGGVWFSIFSGGSYLLVDEISK